jgi:ATP-binding cassette subfamily B protein
MTSAARWWANRARSWLAIIAMVPDAGPAACAAITLNLATGLLPVGFVIGTSLAIERVTAAGRALGSGGRWDAVLAAVAIAVAALLAQALLAPYQAAFTELVSRRVDGVCARRLMRATLTEAPVSLLEEADILDNLGEARRGLVEYFTTPGSAVGGLIATVARYAQLAAAVVIVGVTLGPLAAVVITAAALVSRFGQRGAQARISGVYRQLTKARRQAQYILDTGSEIAAAKEIRVLGTLTWWRARGERDTDTWLRSLWRERRRIMFWPFVWFSLATLAGGIAVLATLAVDADHGRLSVLGLALAVQAVGIPLRFGVYWPEADVQTQNGMQAHAAMTAVEKTAAARALDRVRPGGKPGPGRPAGNAPVSGIAFEKVSFAYPGSDRTILDELDLELPAGTSTAIVGLNGAGKTTLVKLLSRLHEPTGGRITADGTPLTELDSRSWQKRLAVIYQDYVRYELDAAANIGLGAPERIGDTAAMERAIEWAGAADVTAALPDGLATILSSRYPGGVDLSGGQWQRIALARALFAVEAGASVLILDEPTAQLDVRAEVAFFDRFLELTRGLTTIVISHRFSTVRRADRIVVLDGGRITGQGSHEELLAAGGQYAELFELQAKRFADEAAGTEVLAETTAPAEAEEAAS